MGDTLQNEGSDSDWDSTLDFTSPRQTGLNFPPRMEIDDVSDSENSDSHMQLKSEQKNISRNASAMDLKPQEDTSRPVTPLQTTTDTRQQSVPRKTPRQSDGQNTMPANQQAMKTKASDDNPPPYNFKSAVAGSLTPEPVGQKPGKDRKGATYDPAPSPTPRGISQFQDSFKSVGSWDESDQDERTLRELRENYNRQKQKEEEQKQRELQAGPKSEIDDAPSHRSETTWKSLTGRKRTKAGQQTMAAQQPQVSRATTPVQQARSPAPTHQDMVTLTVPSRQQRSEVGSTNDVYAPMHALPPPEVIEPEEEMEEPKTLIFHDEDRGRYVYFFGHGNLRYYEVSEEFEEAVIPGVADKIDRVIRRVWQEFFAVLRILTSVLIWFIVELFRYLAQHLVLPIILGIFVSVGDFFIKPLLSAFFNGFVQPFNIFLWNVFTGLKHVFRPIGVIFLRVLEQIAMCCRSVRLVEINWKTTQRPQTEHRLQTV